MPRLSNDHRKYIGDLWKAMRASVQQAREQDRRWNRINDELNDLLDRKGDTDIVQREKIKGDSLALKNAYAAGQWHQGTAQFYANVIMAEKAAIEMTEGSTQWSR